MREHGCDLDVQMHHHDVQDDARDLLSALRREARPFSHLGFSENLFGAVSLCRAFQVAKNLGDFVDARQQGVQLLELP